jgi:hypothetical protein
MVDNSVLRPPIPALSFSFFCVGTTHRAFLGYLRLSHPSHSKVRVLKCALLLDPRLAKLGKILGLRFPWHSHSWLFSRQTPISGPALSFFGCMRGFVPSSCCHPDRWPNAFCLTAVEGSWRGVRRSPRTLPSHSAYTHWIPDAIGLLWMKQGATTCAFAN